MPDLKDLADNREAILLAEVAAWLHDMGKCSDAFLQPGGKGFNATSCRGNPRVNPHKAVVEPNDLQNLPYWGNLSPERGQCARLEEANHSTALWRTLRRLGIHLHFLEDIDLPIGMISFQELILWGRPLVASRYQAFYPILKQRTHLAATLGWAHKIAHLEKEDEADDIIAKYISSPFGFRYPNTELQKLDSKLKVVAGKLSEARSAFSQSVHINFAKAPGDTRYPINEVTLWDWSSIVAALYKAEIARCVLTDEQREPKEVKWRLLSIRTDGLEYLLSALSIPDLKARQELLRDAWNRVQALLEVEYPLALEVYRDENGPVFVVPDIDNLLGLTDSERNAQTLRELILERFRQGTVRNEGHLALQGEIVPVFKPDSKPWKGQPAPQELPPIGEHVDDKATPPLQNDPLWVSAQWCHLPKPQERCTVCGLRPQGPSSPKALARKVCDVCEQRRDNRAERWVKESFSSTIWLDEVADAHHRLALIVGRFDLTHWLDGTLVRSLAVRTPNDQNGHIAEDVAKNPSFARLRRIWETTRKFWQEVAPTDDGESLEKSLTGKTIGKSGTRRLQIKGKLYSAKKGKDTLGHYHVYEMVLPRGIRLSVVWDPEQERFITADNLAYLAGETQLGKPVEEVLKQGCTFTIQEPVGYGAPDKGWGEITLSEDASEIENSAYTPLIPILAEPRTFMALVPADKAFEVVKAIKTKYEREMGKVRNRLPLHLGVVFADAHQPLRTILDAGRRMLRQRSQPFGWEVKRVQKQPDEGGTLPKRFNDDAKGQFTAWLEIELEKEGQTLTWYVPAVMGDGQTEDHWYPYVFWVQDKDGKTGPAKSTAERRRYYQAPNPFNPDEEGNPQAGWLVHAGELKPGDRIYFTPATFDFQWLAASSDRFGIAYGEQGQRLGLPRRPYLLDDIETLEHIWDTLKKHTSESQIHALVSLIEDKREEWQATPDDETFQQFCHDVLGNLEWQTAPWRKESLDAWVDYAAQGRLTDAVEIFHGIMKERTGTQ